MKNVLSRYKIRNPENIYMLDQDPTESEVRQVFSKITKRLEIGKQNIPMTKFLVIFLFACHGIIKENMQEILLNEFDKKEKFLKRFRAESLIRNISIKYKNAYIITMFACCRQFYNKEKMSGCSSLDEVHAEVLK